MGKIVDTNCSKRLVVSFPGVSHLGVDVGFVVVVFVGAGLELTSLLSG